MRAVVLLLCCQLLIPPPLVAQMAAADATIQPGDRVQLDIWREDELSGEYSVDERGEVVLPMLGVVRVDHLQPGELRDTLREEYGEYLRNPSIEVTVLRRIGVHGEVKQPSLYWVDLTMTLRDAIAMAGGMTVPADPDEIVIVRGTDRIEFDEAGSATVLTADLHSGDQVVVGRKSWIVLNAPWVISTSISVLSILAGYVISR